MPGKKTMSKPPPMTREEGRAYLKRWAVIDEVQSRARNSKTPTEGFREFVRLLRWIDLLGMRAELEREELLSREVWNRLREKHLANAS